MILFGGKTNAKPQSRIVGRVGIYTYLVVGTSRGVGGLRVCRV
jgi:hypothetical protein